MTRGVKTDLQVIQAVLTEIRNGEPVAVASRKANIAWAVVYRVLQKDPALMQAYFAARAHALMEKS